MMMLLDLLNNLLKKSFRELSIARFCAVTMFENVQSHALAIFMTTTCRRKQTLKMKITSIQVIEATSKKGKDHENISVYQFSRSFESNLYYSRIVKYRQRFGFKFSFIKKEKLSKWEENVDIIKSRERLKNLWISLDSITSIFDWCERENFPLKKKEKTRNFSESHE